MNKNVKRNVISVAVTTTMSVAGLILAEKLITKKAEEKQELLENKETLKHTTNLGDIAYTVQGDKEPLILLHDFYVGASHKEWDLVIDELAKTYKVYAVDFIGFGYSSRTDKCWTAYQYAVTIENFIKEVVKEPVNLIGSGGGGDIALILSTTIPENIKNLISISPKGFKENFPSYEQVRNMKLQLLPVNSSANLIRQTSKKSISADMKTKFFNQGILTKEYIENLSTFARIGEHSSVTVAGIKSNFWSCPTTSFFKDSVVSMAVFWGEENQETPIDYMKNAQEMREDVFYVEFDDVGSFPHLENPTVFVDMVNKFLVD